MNYPLIPFSIARELAVGVAATPYPKLAERCWANWEEEYRVFYRPEGERADRRELTELRKMVVEAAKQLGFPAAKLSSEKARDFDEMVEKFLLERLKLSRTHAADARFWAFMTTVLLPDVVKWRYQQSEEKLSLDRFFGEAKRNARNALGRLWWIGKLFTGPDGRRWQDELTQDEIVAVLERPSLSASPRVCQAIAAELVALKSASGGQVSERRVKYRDALKRLRRLAGIVVLDALHDDELARVIGSCFPKRIRLVQLRSGVPTDLEFESDLPVTLGKGGSATTGSYLDLSKCDSAQYLNTQHARLICQDGKFFLKAVERGAPVYIKRIGYEQTTATEIRSGDDFALANTQFRFFVDTHDAKRLAAAAPSLPPETPDRSACSALPGANSTDGQIVGLVAETRAPYARPSESHRSIAELAEIFPAGEDGEPPEHTHLSAEHESVAVNTSANAARLEISLLDERGDLPQKSGLNWGWANGRPRDPFEAYIRLPSRLRSQAERVFGSTRPGTCFYGVTNQGDMIEMCLEGRTSDPSQAKQICSRRDKSTLGRWLIRDCLGLDGNRPVKLEDLMLYGRNSIEFVRLDGEVNGLPVVRMDFSPPAKPDLRAWW